MDFRTFIFIICINCVYRVNSSDVANEKNHFFDLNLYKDVLDSELCEQHLDYISENDLLGIQFLDAGYRTPRGIFMGNLADMGNYFQCLNIHERNEEFSIDGKYCMMKTSIDEDEVEDTKKSELLRLIGYKNVNASLEGFKRKLTESESDTPIKGTMMVLGNNFNDKSPYTSDISTMLSSVQLRLAICIPKSCTPEQALNRLPYDISTFGLELEEEYCRLPGDIQWAPGDYIAIVIFSIIGLLTILSTSYDIYYSVILKTSPKQINSRLQIFSIYTNTRRLLTFSSGRDTLECLDGIRSLAMMWMIVGHTLSLPSMSTLIANPIEYFGYLKPISSLWISSATITVDTFFTLSGILVVYTTAGKFTSMKLLKNVHLFYINRLMRMFPLLALGILLEVSLNNRVTDGPFLQHRAEMVNACRNNWWLTLLYVHNYFRNDSLCLPHSWYLAIDMQLYIIAPIVLFWVYKSRKSAWISIAAALLICLSASAAFNFTQNFPGGPHSPGRESELLIYMRSYYINTLTRASPFFVGMLFGYLLHTLKGQKLVISQAFVGLLWSCITFLILAVTYCHHPIYWDNWTNQIAINIMNTFMRAAWALAISLMILVCAKGYGGPVNWVLSLTMWKFTARISYAVYILHYAIMMVIITSGLQPYYFTPNKLIYRSFSDYTISSLVGFLATLLIDAPFSSIIKIIIGGGRGSEKPKSAKETQDINITDKCKENQ